MEKILRIEEVSFNLPEKKHTSFSGFIITTDKQDILLGIDSNQNCCESWGYFMSNDDFSEFIGASLLDITIADEVLNVHKMPKMYEGGVMFVNINTSAGLLQFTAYNEHNGYYSHEAVVVSKQLTNKDYL